jgi:hypothetical protein
MQLHPGRPRPIVFGHSRAEAREACIARRHRLADAFADEADIERFNPNSAVLISNDDIHDKDGALVRPRALMGFGPYDPKALLGLAPNLMEMWGHEPYVDDLDDVRAIVAGIAPRWRERGVFPTGLTYLNPAGYAIDILYNMKAGHRCEATASASLEGRTILTVATPTTRLATLVSEALNAVHQHSVSNRAVPAPTPAPAPATPLPRPKPSPVPAAPEPEHGTSVDGLRSRFRRVTTGEA